MQAGPRWAVLRHLVLAAGDALAASAGLAAALRLPEGFGDPELAAIGLTDRNMPVGGQKYLEVGPLGPGSCSPPPSGSPPAWIWTPPGCPTACSACALATGRRPARHPADPYQSHTVSRSMERYE